MKSAATLVLVLVLVLDPAALADEMPVHTAAPGDLAVSVERDGRLDAARRAKVRVAPEAYGGPLIVAEVLREGGAVARGEVILRLEAARYEDEMRAAREGLEQQKRALELGRAEQEILLEANRTRVEKAERARELAEQALRLFEEFQGPKMLKAAVLEIESREHSVMSQKEELDQLEKMYQGTKLSSDTKEIVLERARRSVAMAEAWLAISRRDEVVTREHAHPTRLRALKDDLRWESEELEHARETTRISEQKKAQDLEQARIGLRNAEERLQKLERDREQLTVRAPVEGILTPIDLVPGDSVAAKAVLAQVVQPGRLVVRFQATADDLRFIAPGKAVTVVLPDLRDLAVTGTIEDVGRLGAEAKDGTNFPATVALGAPDERLRVGLRAKVRIEGKVAGALAVPRRAVREKGGKSIVYVRRAGGAAAGEPREVTLGYGAGDSVVVVKGLAAGEEVLLVPPGAGASAPAEPKKDEPPGTPPEKTPLSPGQAYERGLRYLLDAQNEDGTWGTWESSRTGESYLGTVASLRAFRDATASLCALALLEPSRRDARARRALERALDHLLATEPSARATGDTYYDTWTHAYLLQALARVHRDERFAARRAALGPAIRREIETLEDRQGAEGGWGYYDFGWALATPSGHESASFVTAVVLLSFEDARAAGFAASADTVAAGAAHIERLRLPSGAYIYGTYAQMRPGALFNHVKGSIGRNQSCNLALYALGRPGISKDDLRAGVRALREHHHFIEIGKSRPYPHEAWYYTAGYYFLFGHYYAGRVISELDPGERDDHRRWLAATLARLQDPDGSWFDFPLYGYHKPYGTAFALLAIESCL